MKKILYLFSILIFTSFDTCAYWQHDAKDACRQKIMKMSEVHVRERDSKAPILGNEIVDNMVDQGGRALKNLEVMESQRLLAAKLNTIPWSDYYWPIDDGLIAFRYMDSEMPSGWQDGYDYFLKNPTIIYINSGKSDLISPAEKYSYANGDLSNILSQSLWNEGKSYIDQYGRVERWMGLCHGWAAASLMYSAPSKKVTYQGVNFYPSDIKALGTLLWANGNFTTKYLGGRCQIRNPKRDEFGRIQDQDCFDINPGAWHMATVNQIGISKRGFVMDATFDFQVWNQPVFSYSYRYFNPVTNIESNLLKETIVEYKTIENDQYVKYRSKKFRYLVGIIMDVEYVLENNPDHSEGPFLPLIHKAIYRYDLELDDHKNIIGGEWHSSQHPDFLWLPVSGAHIKTSNNVLDNARYSLPISSFVELLFNKSSDF